MIFGILSVAWLHLRIKITLLKRNQELSIFCSPTEEFVNLCPLYSLNIGHKLNIHKTFRRLHGRLLASRLYSIYVSRCTSVTTTHQIGVIRLSQNKLVNIKHFSWLKSLIVTRFYVLCDFQQTHVVVSTSVRRLCDVGDVIKTSYRR